MTKRKFKPTAKNVDRFVAWAQYYNANPGTSGRTMNVVLAVLGRPGSIKGRKIG